MLVLDGVFAHDADHSAPSFHKDDPPTRAELVEIAETVYERFVRWLGRRGLIRDDAYAPDTETTALDVCIQTTLRLGVLGTLDGDGHIESPDPDDVRFGDRKKGTHVGEAKGFSIHAGVVVGQGDFEGRERLARYCSRPAISLERLSLTGDGRIAYRIKRSSLSSGPTHRLMTPLEFMSRLAALLPPPRHPLIRFHGVLAAHAKWRPTVVPRPPAEPRSCASGRTGDTPNPGDATPSAARPKNRTQREDILDPHWRRLHQQGRLHHDPARRPPGLGKASDPRGRGARRPRRPKGEAVTNSKSGVLAGTETSTWTSLFLRRRLYGRTTSRDEHIWKDASVTAGSSVCTVGVVHRARSLTHLMSADSLLSSFDMSRSDPSITWADPSKLCRSDGRGSDRLRDIAAYLSMDCAGGLCSRLCVVRRKRRESTKSTKR